MRPQLHRTLTAQEFFWLADADAKELVDGRIVPMTPTFFAHGRVASCFVQLLREHAVATRAGEVVTAEVGFITRHQPDRVRAPDVAFVSQARLTARDLDGGFFDGAPDLVVEVLSPGDRAVEVQAKIDEYFAAGALLVWIADPGSATVTVHRAGGSSAVLRVGDVLGGEAVLPGLRIELAQLFAH